MQRRSLSEIEREARERARRTLQQASRRLAEGLQDDDLLPLAPQAYGLATDAVVALPAKGQILYRLVWHDPPDGGDFRSNREKNRPPFSDEAGILHTGVSMFSRVDQALGQARRYPKRVAAVTLAEGKGFSVANTRGSGHYTVWGDPDVLAEQAVVVHTDEGP